MTTRTIRKIVKIDEEKCNGCGVCALKCAEGALQIIDGKARLISDKYCDGLGACLGECPEGAITIEARESEEFDEKAVEHHLHEKTASRPLPCGCPATAVQHFEATEPAHEVADLPSMLTQWPVQLTLVPPGAPFLNGADLLLAAHCAPFACAGFHQTFLKGHKLLIACPKLDDFDAHQQKLIQILRQSNIKSITVVHMEVPCCMGLVHMAKQALRLSGKDMPFEEVTIGIRGDIK